MFRIVLSLIAVCFLVSCSTDPRPLVYGQDSCHHCKMTLVDPKYGSELVTEKGKVFVFDDMNCMLSYLGEAENEGTVFKHLLVTDYLNEGVFIEAKDAFYLKSEQFKTPMASQIVAFGDYDQLKKYKNEAGGIYLAWGELVTQFK